MSIIKRRFIKIGSSRELLSCALLYESLPESQFKGNSDLLQIFQPSQNCSDVTCAMIDWNICRRSEFQLHWLSGRLSYDRTQAQWEQLLSEGALKSLSMYAFLTRYFFNSRTISIKKWTENWWANSLFNKELSRYTFSLTLTTNKRRQDVLKPN